MKDEGAEIALEWKKLHPVDKCEFCDGTRGVYGNENVINGRIICDYCHSEGRDGHGSPLPVYDFIKLLDLALGDESKWTRIQKAIYTTLCEKYIAAHTLMHTRWNEKDCNCKSSWKEKK